MSGPPGKRGNPRFPTGRFEAFPALEATDREGLVARLAAFPEELRAAVSEMSAAQLDTPYREGGWTGRQVVARLTALLSELAPADFARPFEHAEGYDGTVDTLLQLYAWHGRHHLGHLRLLT